MSDNPLVSLSPLDQERFGFPIARCNEVTAEHLPEVLGYCSSRGVRMLIVRCACEDILAAQAIERAGGLLMDTLVYYRRSLDEGVPEALADSVRLLRREDSDQVRAVAAACFQGYFGHYHADGRLDRSKADEAYVSWAERSCIDPSVASTVLVSERDGRIAGFLTMLGRGPQEAEIMLNGVAPEFQRHGVYRGLVLAALHHCRAGGIRTLKVSTQLVNLGVQKTWARLGFELGQAYYTFHLWFDCGLAAQVSR